MEMAEDLTTAFFNVGTLQDMKAKAREVLGRGALLVENEGRMVAEVPVATQDGYRIDRYRLVLREGETIPYAGGRDFKTDMFLAWERVEAAK